MTDSGSPSSAIAPSAADDRRTAAHVGLLAHDVGLRLEEVAAGVERDGLADERQPRRSGAPGGSWRRTTSSGRTGLLPPTAASAPSPASVASMVSQRTRGIAAARSASPAGEIRFGGSSTSSRAMLVQRADQRGALGHRCQLVAAAADHEPLDAARRLAAAPAAAVVAAEDGALGQRADLLRLQRQRRVERPGDRAAVAARAHRLRRGGPQPRRGRVPRRPAARRRVHHRHRIGVPDGALRSPQRHARPPGAATRSAPTANGSAAVTRLPSSHPNRRHQMTWVKPKFEIVELCSEVTSYLYQR